MIYRWFVKLAVVRHEQSGARVRYKYNLSSSPSVFNYLNSYLPLIVPFKSSNR